MESENSKAMSLAAPAHVPHDELYDRQVEQAHLDDDLRPPARESFLAHLPQYLTVSFYYQVVPDREDRRVEHGGYRGNYLSYGHIFGHSTPFASLPSSHSLARPTRFPDKVAHCHAYSKPSVDSAPQDEERCIDGRARRSLLVLRLAVIGAGVRVEEGLGLWTEAERRPAPVRPGPPNSSRFAPPLGERTDPL
jgi:hypothetical protein